MTAKAVAISFIAFLAPLVVAVGWNWEALTAAEAIDPKTAPGRILYFTAPS